MKKLNFVLIACSSLLVAASAMAQDAFNPNDVSLGQPGYGGNGCPQGSASAVLSPDSKSLSILFDSFVAQAGGTTGVRLDRKTCNIAVPVHVPGGYSVSVLSIDYRGFNRVPRGAYSRFNVEYFFAGQRGPVASRTFLGEQTSDYLFHNDLVATAFTWSRCGEDVTLRANTSMIAQTNRWDEETMATVDSADISAGLVYTLQWRRCQ